MLTHDFGVVTPGKPIAHEFEIVNDTDSPWQFQSFHTTCGCTVGSISSETIPAHGKTTVTLNYRPPSQVGNDKRQIELHLKESNAPLYQLQVTAKARLPVTVFPIEFRIDRATHDRSIQRKLEVSNYTGAKLPPPTITASADWLNVGKPQIAAIPKDDPTVRQQWDVPVELATDTIDPGEYSATLTLKREGAEPITIPISVVVAPALEPSPRQLFFGTLKSGEAKTVKFMVQTPSDIVGTITMKHEFGHRLKLEQTRQLPGRTFWTATLTPSAKDIGELQGTVTIEAGPGVPPTKLPMIAMVQP